MRKYFIFTVIICIFIQASAFSGFELLFSGKQEESALTACFKEKNSLYALKIQQENDGRFSYYTVPAFQVTLKKLSLGEIKYDIYGINKPKQLSFKPKLSGVSFFSSNIDFACFSSLFSPYSPDGALIVFKSDYSILQFSCKNYSSFNRSPVPSFWQVDWNKRTAFGPVFESSALLRNSFSRLVLKFYASKNNGFYINSDFSLAEKGLEIQIKHDRNIENTLSYSVGNNHFRLKTSVNVKKGLKPIYGGTAQNASVEYSNTLILGNISAYISSVNNYEETTGKSSYTRFGLNVFNSDYSLKIYSDYVRTVNTKNGFSLPEIEFDCNNICFYTENSKAFVEIVKTIQINGKNMDIMFNSKREFEIKFSATV